MSSKVKAFVKDGKKLMTASLINGVESRPVEVRELNGAVYLFITPKRYIGKGATLEDAISNSRLNVWTTGLMAKWVEV